MAPIAQTFALAWQHHQAGDLQQAQQLYQSILEREPAHLDAWCFLGAACQAQGRTLEAEAAFHRALKLAPHHVMAWNWLGIVVAQQGKLEEAAACFREVLRHQPTNAEASNNLGVALERQGKLDEAAHSFGQALGQAPDHAEAHHNLGRVRRKQGRFVEAVASFQQALEHRPGYAQAHNDLASALAEQGKLAEAVASYQHALRLDPGFADAHYNLGCVLHNLGGIAQAIASYREALRLRPDSVHAHTNLGNVLGKLGQWDQAAACYQQVVWLRPNTAPAHHNLALARAELGQLAEAATGYEQALLLAPDYPEAHYNLGRLRRKQGRHEEAAACYRRALEARPDYVEAHHGLGNVLTDLGKPQEAVAALRQVLRLQPDHAEAHNSLGVAWSKGGEQDQAVACYQRALALKPDFAEASNNLGSARKIRGELGEAIACFQRALQLRPDLAEAHYNLGETWRDRGDPEEAVACFRRAVQLRPGYLAAESCLAHGLQHLCLWEEMEELSRRIIDAVDRGSADTVPPFIFLALPVPTTGEQQCRCARQYVNQLLKPVPGRPPAAARPDGVRPRLRLGYLSADFHAHATAYLTAELFEKHDRTRFEVLGYSYGPDDGSPMRRRLVAAFDQFVDINAVSALEAVERIQTDGVDILIDLKGHTQHARPEILALRPAPIQVNYLGYPGTMGAPFMDYIVVDDFVVPPQQQPYFTENLVHLPGCYQVNDGRRAISPHTPARSRCGLPEEGLVFCCFNGNYKITPEVFGVWMRLLRAVPGSVLWLLESNRTASANLRLQAEAQGVTSGRLVFAPPRPLAEHLARLRLADLFLDTYPVNAHTTASDALWVGCPVLTLAGDTFVSRVAGSLLRTLGLPELVTTSFAEYEDRALQLARDAKQLVDLRARLEAGREAAGLFDAVRFAGNLERALLRMWEIHAAGDSPRAFAV